VISFRSTLIAAALLAAACGSDASRGPGHFARAPVILITVDTLRADHLPAYGYRQVETPNIDGLRRDSVLFERVYSHCPMTLPSHASMFTGSLPPENGVRNNIGYRFDGARFKTLAEELRDRGYATGAAVMIRKDAITRRYEERERRGQVVITTADPAACSAVHDFLRAQIADHRTGESGGMTELLLYKRPLRAHSASAG
jgi:arylsulfatase A-like enzyme